MGRDAGLPRRLGRACGDVRGFQDKAPRTGLVVAIVSLVGLSIVGCCDESENFPLHVTGALVFFYGYDIWTVCAVVDDASCRARVACAFVCWLCAPIHMRHIMHVPSSILDALAVLEWANALAIIGFMLLDGPWRTRRRWPSASSAPSRTV